MERKEFSDLLVANRELEKCSKNEMCRRMSITFSRLQSIEMAKNNYRLTPVIAYLSAIDLCLCFTKNEEEWVIVDYLDFVKWVVAARGSDIRQRPLAKAIDVSYATMSNIERESSVAGIDTVLKIAEVLGFTVKIKKISHG